MDRGSIPFCETLTRMVCLIYYIFKNNFNILYYFLHIIYCELQKAKAKGVLVSIVDAYRHTKTKGHDGVTWLFEKDRIMAVYMWT